MSKLRRKQLADGYSMMDAPSGAGFYYNYESQINPELFEGTGIKQFNTLDREENYAKYDQDIDVPEWQLQESASSHALSRLRAKKSSKNHKM